VRPLRTLFLVNLIALAVAQTQLTTFFSESDLAALERLVAVAEQNSPGVLEAAGRLKSEQQSVSLEGRLAQALEVRAGTELSGDFYQQVTPSYSISLSLNVMDLLEREGDTDILTARLETARAESRLETVSAFVRYRVALEAAESAAQALESSEASYRVVSARLEAGEATLTDQIRARSAVADVAVTLLRANGEAITALENLSLVVGLGPEATLQLIRGEP
jgi:outer membrane protein TolC